MPSFKKTLEYVYGLEKAGIRPGLERIKKLLSSIGQPQHAWPSVHVAGTNGKGSTSAMLASILTEAGYRAGLYTSPHLVRFNERIRVDGKEINDAELVRIAQALMMAGRAIEPSFFEFTTALAFQYFKEKKVDIAVIETGMGGRFDATNVLNPLVSIITNVDIDHTEFLGQTLGAIAREKAGIIKRGTAVVTAESKRPAISVIKKMARQKGSPLFRLAKDFSFRQRPDRKGLPCFDYCGAKLNISGLTLGLRGRHQLKNSSCALFAVEILKDAGFNINGRAIRQGLKKTFWPARLEVVKKRPLVIIDSAHNPAGAITLGDALGGFRYKRLILVFGIMKDKDAAGFLKTVGPLADVLILTAAKTERATEPEKLFKRIRMHNKKILICKDVETGLKAAFSEAGRDDAVCVAGSIFVAGEAKAVLSERAIAGAL